MNYNKEPQICIGDYLGPYITAVLLVGVGAKLGFHVTFAKTAGPSCRQCSGDIWGLGFRGLGLKDLRV